MKALTKEQQKIVEDNMGLVYKFCSTQGNKYNFDFEDTIQIASVGLIKAVIFWDKNKGSLSTLAYTCMNREFLMAIRSRNKHDKLGCIQSLNEPLLSDLDYDLTLEDVITDNKNLIDFILLKTSVESAYAKLNDKQKDVVYRYLVLGQKQIEIAKSLNLSQAHISRIITKFKDLIKED